MGVLERTKKRLENNPLVRTFNFDWPTNNTVTTRLRDILETTVAEKYYLSDAKTANLLSQLEKTTGDTLGDYDSGDVLQRSQSGVRGRDIYGTLRAEASTTEFGVVEKYSETFCIDDQGRTTKSLKPTDVVPTLRAQSHENEPRVVELDTTITDGEIHVVGSLEHYGNDAMNRVYGVDGVSPTVLTPTGGGLDTKIAELQQYSDGSGLAYNVDANYFRGTSVGDIGKGRRTHVVEPVECLPVLTPDRPEKRQNGRRFKEDGEPSFTLTAQDRHGVALRPLGQRYRIRKLTPLECWRLQSFTDDQFRLAQSSGISDSQLYKMAGNAVTVNVIRAIGKPLISMLNKVPAEVA